MLEKSLFLERRFLEMRNNSKVICESLELEDYVVQPNPEVSPPKWHLAHTTWFLEEIILNKYQKNYKFYNPHFKKFFNSYYKSLGEHWIQARRGDLSRPTVAEIYAYRESIDNQLMLLLTKNRHLGELYHLLELAINHEEQHQELLYMDIKYILGSNPIMPCYSNQFFEKEYPVKENWNFFTEGIYNVGESASDSFYFDNESPCHKVYVYPFGISDRLVTNGEFLNFINDGGYEQPLLWLSKGLDWVIENKIKAPLYWSQLDSEWSEFTLNGEMKLDLNLPVSHISYYEAEAFARWMGMRLPTEQEYEVSTERSPSSDNLKGLHPTNAGTNKSQLWCWTQSHYSPYPGFKPYKGKISEYNGKFMCNQFVLRGGCVVTPEGHYRKTYRNFYEPHQRWMFSGICLAKDYL
ncbi:MAG: ergothioneine biosynthesis protein EgtB [Bacteriovorax sp.]|nr:ergothioneine biosynthesis protein EgtB [Bacteriovorax sp.]